MSSFIRGKTVKIDSLNCQDDNLGLTHLDILDLVSQLRWINIRHYKNYEIIYESAFTITVEEDAIKFNCHGPDSRLRHARVFITIDSEGQVSFFGKVTVRNVVLNWMTPDELVSADWIGLFEHDVRREKVLHRAHASFVLNLNSTQDTSFKTEFEFPYQSYPESESCIHFFVAYVRDSQVLATNCLQTHPNWMFNLKDEIGFLALSKLMIPGTHLSHRSRKFEGYFANSITKRWAYTQEESFWNQLVMGIRYLEVELDGSKWEVDKKLHQLYNNCSKINNSQALPDIVQLLHRDLQNFFNFSKDVVILRFKFIRSSSKPHLETMPEILDILFHNLTLPFTPDLTLDEALASDKRLILSFEEELAETLDVTSSDAKRDQSRTKKNFSSHCQSFNDKAKLWPAIDQVWNREAITLVKLEHSLGKTFAERDVALASNSRITYQPLVADIVALGYSLGDVLLDTFKIHGKAVRSKADTVAKNMFQWFHNRWWDKANVVTVDFFMSTDIVSIAIEVNRKRSFCARRGERPDLMENKTELPGNLEVQEELQKERVIMELKKLVSIETKMAKNETSKE